MGEFLWNMDDGFVDALVRGWRSGFLSDLEYTNLKEGECGRKQPAAPRAPPSCSRVRGAAPPRTTPVPRFTHARTHAHARTPSRAGGRRGGDKGGKEDFEDLRLTLQETDFGAFLAQEPSLDP